MKTNKGYFFRACYSKGVSHQCLAEAQGRQQNGKALWWRKGNVSRMPSLEAGELETAKLEQDISCDYFGELILN